ncbi:MAG TPA: Gfo/Idh/MocA family oxidoreductase [Streptosporangiaceae bacterium]|nr:Gfo/Idh/MocA family oxidoreductase [Streptosporangiaceae bacterium]
MSSYSCAVVAAGSQGRVHAQGYAAQAARAAGPGAGPGAELVAVADVNVAAARELAQDLGIPGVYDSHEEMLKAEHPDVVSICTPPSTHLEVARAAVAAGVRAIHCEKPIATSYADVLTMHELARDAGVQLTFNLQRRFEPVHRFAREQIAAGAIGTVVSLEGYCPNLPDWGSHIVDLMLFYLGDRPPTWVMGQVDVTVNRYVYGAFAETSSLTQVKWEDGVNALIMTGREPQTPLLNIENNLGLLVQGTGGRVDARGARCLVHRFGADDIVFESPCSRDSSMWERRVDPAIVACTAEAIADLLASLDEGQPPVLRSELGVRGAEIIFATYESSRSRRRVGLPLDVHDNALRSGLEQGFWQPVGEQRSTY